MRRLPHFCLICLLLATAGVAAEPAAGGPVAIPPLDGVPASASATAAATAPVVVSATATGAAGAPVSTGPEVLLAPGDELRISVYDNADLDVTVRVSRDPSAFPLIGDIGSLVGLSPAQVARLVTTRLADGYLLRPVVSVLVLNFSPRIVSVLGSVRLPQRIQVDPHTTITALQVLAQAGGLLDDADRSRILILRADPRGTGQVEMLTLAAPAADDTRLRPGDTVVVPRFDRAYVMGEVARPGPVQIENDTPMTVTRAVSMAGGFQRFARKSKVQLLRDGQTTTIDVDAILAGKGKDDSVLKPGDVVFVPESIF